MYEILLLFLKNVVNKARARDHVYQTVIRDLIKRYIMARQRSQHTDGVTEDDLNEIKQDISTFRYELFETLRESGMNVSQHQSQKAKSKHELRKWRVQRLL